MMNYSTANTSSANQKLVPQLKQLDALKMANPSPADYLVTCNLPTCGSITCNQNQVG
jgi:hypothetical protein